MELLSSLRASFDLAAQSNYNHAEIIRQNHQHSSRQRFNTTTTSTTISTISFLSFSSSLFKSFLQTGTASTNCCIHDVRLFHFIFGLLNDFLSCLFCKRKESAENQKVYYSALNRPNFVVRPQLLVPGRLYTFVLTATSDKSIGSASVLVEVNRPPRGGFFEEIVVEEVTKQVHALHHSVDVKKLFSTIAWLLYY